ncbi:latexin isoform X1 [Hippoglossus hippoglossus]|uniref:latexin isoform X1 n=2 Tax=Hippoglossus hippoglossus TaxID=8267 RepID=UPI00148C29CA|nr:latexin isoform X1 [Hippoglossus hippoglossus]
MMGLTIIVFLALLTGVTGSPNVTIRPEAASADDVLAHSNSVPETSEETEIVGQQNVSEPEETLEDVMATGELNANHYPAQRAAKVVQHYLNTLHGSPYRVIGLNRVHSGYAEDVADSGRKYNLEISVQDFISNKTEKCTAEVLFPMGEQQRPPQVQASLEELPKTNTKAEEEALFKKYKTNQSLLLANLPDSYGHIDPDMEPFWHLGTVASSFIMLNESTENTLYNMAQVANITQLKIENDQLKFDYHVLLHEMISQEIIHWKLLFTWSPPEGVKVLQMEQLPNSHHYETPQNKN